MLLKVVQLNARFEHNSVVISDKDSDYMGIKEGDRVSLDGRIYASVVRSEMLSAGSVALPFNVIAESEMSEGSEIEVEYVPKPDSVGYIRDKIDGDELSEEKITAIIRDTFEKKLTQSDVAMWLTALQIRGATMEEIAYMVKAMANTGDILDFHGKDVYDFHSMGGAPGNKITPIVISILAAAGMVIPKTSTRAISSACGTIDFADMFFDVALSTDRLKEVAETVGCALAWGGTASMVPVDDMIIKTEYAVNLNPRPQMLASIMSKKYAAGANRLLIEVPMGKGTKVPNVDVADGFIRDFKALGNVLGIKVECIVTDADDPLGTCVGPALEARECLQVLEGTGDQEVASKACLVAGRLLDMEYSDGYGMAKELLSSGKARERFLAMAKAQGEYTVDSSGIRPGMYTFDIVSDRDGEVYDIHNKVVVRTARELGAPVDKGAGIVFHKRRGDRVSKGDVLMTFYADNEAKLTRVKDIDPDSMIVLGV